MWPEVMILLQRVGWVILTQHLERFDRLFVGSKFDRLFVGSNDPTYSLEFKMDLAILKHKFYVRDAWDVGLHDIDMVTFQPDDNVIIPADEIDPPVKKLLAYLNEMKKGV